MIDYIRMNTVIDIPVTSFDSSDWRLTYNDGFALYIHNHIGVTFCYSVRSGRLSFLGRLYNLSENPNRIGNLDLLEEGLAGIRIEQEQQADGTVKYYAQSYTQDLDQLIDQTNTYINNLLNITVDIRTFKVTHIEFCFNLYTTHVEEYCRMFNRVFTEHPHASYTSHVERQSLEPHTSFYIKSNAQYRKNEEDRYVINFYNKLDQLSYLINKAYKDGKEVEPGRFGDITGAINLFRMEVKVGHLALNKLYDENGLERPFQVFLDPLVAKDIILRQYERIIGCHSSYFCSYEEACHIIDSSDYSKAQKRSIRQFILDYVRHQNAPCPNTWYKYVKLLKNIGIHWCLIPASHGIPRLESPIALLDRHISDIEENKANMERRFLITELEAEYYNSIEEEEEDVIQIPDEILDSLDS